MSKENRKPKYKDDWDMGEKTYTIKEVKINGTSTFYPMYKEERCAYLIGHQIQEYNYYTEWLGPTEYLKKHNIPTSEWLNPIYNHKQLDRISFNNKADAEAYIQKQIDAIPIETIHEFKPKQR
jgi:hypothetical protein